MDKSLRSWRLTPNKDSELWSHSNYRGEVWVRAHDAIEARNLAARRFRVYPRSSDRPRGRMESPWYARELTRCEVDQNPRFDSIKVPCVVCPAPDGKALPATAKAEAEEPVIAKKPATETVYNDGFAHLQRASHDVIASDVRRVIVRLLLAKKLDVPGRWLDVYVARKDDNEPIYVIIPAPRLKSVIAEELAPLINRTLNDQETKWILFGEDIDRLLGSGDSNLRAA